MCENLGPVITYELKQETPMIHFQYNESGAVIRASELKPKLDDFIKHVVGNVPDEWYLCEMKNGKRTNEALNYKVKIVGLGEKKESADINKMYFGNMGDDNIKKCTVMYNAGVKITIICFVPELQQAIYDNLYEFFLVTNFGTRQSKGFGGFTLTKRNGEIIEENPLKILSSKNYRYIYAQYDEKPDIDKSMNEAAMVYVIMKSGINMSKNQNAWQFASKYQKFGIKDYDIAALLKKIDKDFEAVDADDLKKLIGIVASDKQLKKTAQGWKDCISICRNFPGRTFGEKVNQAYKDELCFYNENKYIKGFMNAGSGLELKGDKAFIKANDALWRADGSKVNRRKIECKGKNNGDEKKEYKFLRALLGLADNYKYKDPDKKRDGTVYIRNFKDVSVQNGNIVKANNDTDLEIDIARFQSPITIKIYKNQFIFIFNEIPKELLGKYFYISKEKETEKKEEALASHNFIQVPEQWDWNRFIDEFVDYYSSREVQLKIKELNYLYPGATPLTLQKGK